MFLNYFDSLISIFFKIIIIIKYYFNIFLNKKYFKIQPLSNYKNRPNAICFPKNHLDS